LKSQAKSIIVLVMFRHAATKKGQQGDIAKALTLWAEYKQRKAAAKPKHRR
jgi:hypothetical protein